MEKRRLVVVLPTYNEDQNIEKTIHDVLSQQDHLPGWEIHVLVVDDIRSSDKTEEIVKNISQIERRVHLIKVEPGLGVGLIKGHQYCLENLQPDILAQLDADGQVVPDVLVRMVGKIEEGYNLVIGSRFVSGGKNQLSLSRRLFSAGSSWFCRLVMGPFNVREFTNSARAFTPELFKKVNLNRLPWKEKTFIVQPAFLNEAILAGAKYAEVPLIFKNRAEGYSKNKVVNYTYDVVTYAIDARFKKWGIDFPLFYLTRRAKTIIKFGVVGFIGTLVDFIFYNIFISTFTIRPATSKGLSTMIAILNNFSLNNLWTFRYRKTKTGYFSKLIIFYIVSSGGLAIGVLIVKLLHLIYGDGRVEIIGLNVPYYNIYFFVTIPPVMLWNFTINHFVTWKRQTD